MRFDCRAEAYQAFSKDVVSHDTKIPLCLLLFVVCLLLLFAFLLMLTTSSLILLVGTTCAGL